MSPDATRKQDPTGILDSKNPLQLNPVLEPHY